MLKFFTLVEKLNYSKPMANAGPVWRHIATQNFKWPRKLFLFKRCTKLFLSWRLHRLSTAIYWRVVSEMARRARDKLAPLRRSSAGRMPARMGRLSAGVARRHPVTIHNSLLMTRSMRQMWALRNQAREQYIAVKRTMSKAAVSNIVAPAPQPEPAICLKSTTRDVKFLRSYSGCPRCVSDQQCELHPKTGRCGPLTRISNWNVLLALV